MTKQVSDTGDVLIWGAIEIGAAINRTARQVHHLNDIGVLPVVKIGGQLVGKRRELRSPACWPKPPKGE